MLTSLSLAALALLPLANALVRKDGVVGDPLSEKKATDKLLTREKGEITGLRME